MPYKDKQKQKIYLKSYRIKNLEKSRRSSKDWNNNNKDKHKESNHNWFMKNRKLTYNRHIEHRLKHLYGITINEYNQMFVNQNGLCAICKEGQTNNKKLVVDHNHVSGKVRGLLCSNCNTGIGFLKENEKTLLEAIVYLKNN